MSTSELHKNNIEFSKDSKPCRNYSGGEWRPATGEPFQILSPYTNKVIGMGRSTAAIDLEEMIRIAKNSQIKWAQIPIKERCQVMFKFRDLLHRNLNPLIHQIAEESGKTLIEAEAEVLKGIEVTEFATALQNLDVGGKMEVSRGVFCEYRREPLGVVAAITPFNFPAMVPMWMIPIAITLGNAFIWKPSEKTPMTSLLLADLLEQAGVPKGIFSVAQGGRSTVELILDHPEIEAIGFVGSSAVAKEVYRRGTQNFKRVLALGGAKNHIILMPDADLELTAKGIGDSFTGCAGQRCMAASVLCTVASNSDDQIKIDNLLNSIVEYAKTIPLGEKMGAIISKESLNRIENAVNDSEREGAKILLDGRYPKISGKFTTGNWIAPTVLDQIKPGSQAAIEELFGPVLSIIRCTSLAEALKIQQTSAYGNAISIFTQNGSAAEIVAQNGQSGMVGINIGVPVPREPFSFGGIKESKYGHGDITGTHSLDFWSHIKKVTTKWAPQRDTTWMG